MTSQKLQYVLIVGVGRSGTTLLQSMVNAHRQIALLPETHFVIAHLVPHTEDPLQEAQQCLLDDAKFSRLGLDAEDVFSPFTSGEKPFSQAALFIEMMDQYAREHDVSIVGDKAPKNIEYLSLLKQIVPEAYVIHLIRDPRDVYLSRTKAAWCSGRPDTHQYLAYRAQIQMGRETGQQLFGDHYLELTYEQLITDPAAELKKVTELLGIPFDEAMLDFGDSGKRLVAADEADWKRNVSGPLLTKNMNKWREQMTPSQVRKLEAACWPVFAEKLYEPAEGFGKKLGFRGKLLNGYFAILSWAYRKRIKRINQRCARILGLQQERETR